MYRRQKMVNIISAILLMRVGSDKFFKTLPMSKINRGIHTSNTISSFSSHSFMRNDDTANERTLLNIPAKAEQLPTGLKLILDAKFVNAVWHSEKKREVLQELLVTGSCSLANQYLEKVHDTRAHHPKFRKARNPAHL